MHQLKKIKSNFYEALKRHKKRLLPAMLCLGDSGLRERTVSGMEHFTYVRIRRILKITLLVIRIIFNIFLRKE